MVNAIRPFFMVHPAGRTYLEVQVLHSPGKGKSYPNGKGVAGDRESEGSRRQNAGLTNRKRIRGGAVGRGVHYHQSPMWNAGASHMNAAFPKVTLMHSGWPRCWTPGSVSRLLNEPLYAEPHVRWCERAAGVTPLPTRLSSCNEVKQDLDFGLGALAHADEHDCDQHGQR